MEDRAGRFLVTGARGVLGSRIVRLLQSARTDVVAYPGDILNVPDLMNIFARTGQITNVINCAAVVAVSKVSAKPIKAFQVNATGAARLAEISSQSFPGAHFLQVSTSHVYKPSTRSIPESGTREPQNTYGMTKLAAEHLIAEIAVAREQAHSFARVFSMYSEDQSAEFLFSRIKALGPDESGTIPLAGWNNLRDFSSADDIARCIVWLSQNRITGPVNVGSGIGESVGEFAARMLGRSVSFRDDLASEQPNSIVADISLLRELGWSW